MDEQLQNGQEERRRNQEKKPEEEIWKLKQIKVK